jgi:chemotaxis receptor (MCP) glutamine deamidase CheD
VGTGIANLDDLSSGSHFQKSEAGMTSDNLQIVTAHALEQRELEQLEKDMEELNAEKERIEALLSGGTASMDEIAGASERFGEVRDLLDEKEMRWLELSEIEGS